jgi:hypothetical protein
MILYHVLIEGWKNIILTKKVFISLSFIFVFILEIKIANNSMMPSVTKCLVKDTNGP